jgi:rSAM/selenodomain-associated transferase 1
VSAVATRIVIFAKAPVAGKAKTRLIPMLGEKGAARLAQRMLADTVVHAKAAGLGMPELCATPPASDGAWTEFLPAGVRLSDQGGGDLGQRLAAAARRVIDAGERVLLIGTDCPALDGERIAAAAAQLEGHDAVIYPARDGGYVLLGLARTDPSLFSDIAWSTDTVAATTMARIGDLGWSLFVGETLIDIDEPEDLEAVGLESRWPS